MNYLIGIDGGGTSCRAILARQDGTRLGEGRTGSANIVTDMASALENIIDASLMAVQEAGLSRDIIPQSSAVLGLAGANISNRNDLLKPLLPFHACTIETDARIALQGALGDNDGAVAIVGTGSNFIARQNGIIRSIGGWGFAVGDFCSGARLGRKLLQQVLLAYDRVQEGSELTTAVMRSFGDSPHTLVEYAQTAKPGDFGTFAPLLFSFADDNDPTACAIVDDAVHDLEENLTTLIGTGDLPYCLLGGLAQSYSKRLTGPFAARQLTPRKNALEGAMAMAVARYGTAPIAGEPVHV